MNPSLTESPTLSRRGVLKIGLCASAFLATAGLGASLSGCSSSTPASGFAMLPAVTYRSSAVIPCARRRGHARKSPVD